MILWIAFTVAPAGPPSGSLSLVDLAKSSGPNFAVFTLFASASFLLVVVVALFFGDTIASEASWSSLRYLLAAPIPRARLVRQKAIVAGLLSLAAIVLLPVVALLVGALAYGADDLVSPTGESLPFWAGALRLLLGALYLFRVPGLGRRARAGAVGVHRRPARRRRRHGDGGRSSRRSSTRSRRWRACATTCPPTTARRGPNLLATDVDWDSMTRGIFSSLLYATVLGGLAVWRFTRKDITS